MAELKTKATKRSVEEYLNELTLPKREDANVLIDLMKDITHENPVMWGDSIVGFGAINLTYASRRNIDYFLIGFAVRKSAITLYLSIEVNRKVFDGLGKHTKGVGCLYIQKLADINLSELRLILEESVAVLKNRS